MPPEADAHLYLVLTETLEEVDGPKSDGQRVSGAMRVLQALDAHGTHFDLPGWELVRLSGRPPPSRRVDDEVGPHLRSGGLLCLLQRDRLCR